MIYLRKYSFLFIFFACVSSSQGWADQVLDEHNPESLAPPCPAAQPNSFDMNSESLSAPAPTPEIKIANLSDGEKRWYQRFQEGVPFFDGWKKITERVIEKFPEQEREQKMAIMQALGLKIGHEWCRDNRVRKVNTDMLQAWGQDLRQAGSQNHIQLARVIQKIDGEINTLLYHQ
jgi:hypothetical protein